jgi:Fur family ferric uptake transcriptional regulator
MKELVVRTCNKNKMTCTLEFAPQLRARGFRMTSQRMAILHVLHDAGAHLSPVEVYKQAKAELPGITEPTVYRTLEFLADNGLARPSFSSSGHLRYEITGNEHHHIICRVCNGEIEVEHSMLESLYFLLEESSGYQRIDSHVTFFGICPECQTT